MTVTPAPGDDALLKRALDLFEFLKQCQMLNASPVLTTDVYQREGSLLWLDELPDHPAVEGGPTATDTAPDAPLMTITRVAVVDPPEPSDLVAPFLVGTVDNADKEPTLRDSVRAGALPAAARGDRDDSVQVRPHELSRFEDEHAAWLTKWRDWADQERIDQPARELYTSVFSTYLKAMNHPEEFELVAGFGLLAWRPEGHPESRRHLFTIPVDVALDEATGEIQVRRQEALDPPRLELDMLDPGLIANTTAINAVRELASAFEHHPLVPDLSSDLVRRVVHALDAQGEFLTDPGATPAGPSPRARFRPALILRKRSQRGLIGVYEQLIEQLIESGEVPAGLIPLIDPDRQPSSQSDSTPGGVVDVDGEPFLPLPVNERQLEVIRRVDRSAQTLVQGPPGTGKTHTAAALISHLLAQGKRVLITAQTDRALHEVKGKLPHAIKPLAVAVVGSSRSDMADLKMAVERISSKAVEHDPAAAERDIADTLQAIDGLRRERAALKARLVDVRTQETVEHERDEQRGTLAALAQRYQAEAEIHGWISTYGSIDHETPAPLRNQEALALLRLLRDHELAADETEAAADLASVTSLPIPADFSGMCIDEGGAQQQVEALNTLRNHHAYPALSALEPSVRRGVQERLHAFSTEAAELERRHEAWMNSALSDVLMGRGTTWSDRAERVETLMATARERMTDLPLGTQVVISQSADRGALLSLARNLLSHLEGGGKIKVLPTGQPKIGAFSPAAVKQATPLFEAVRVNHVPPTDAVALHAFLAFAAAEDLIDQLDRAWPSEVVIPEEDTLEERVQWHATEVVLLRRLLALGDRMSTEEGTLAELKVPKPEWSNLKAVTEFADVVDAAAAVDDHAAKRLPLADLASALDAIIRGMRAATATSRLSDAVRTRDAAAYADAYDRTLRLWQVRDEVAERKRLQAQLADRLPELASHVAQEPEAPIWDDRLADFERAWSWSALGSWIRTRPSVDVNVLQASLTHVESQIRAKVEHLAAARAWSHALSQERLTGSARADLSNYAQQVRRLGKGTGKYASLQRAEIRKAMDRCRPSVPVWIMPIYRIAEQLTISANMFDVVVVDEASQAGREATFLQYLAPKIVVIGDDKQVSPAAVGVDQRQIIDLSNQFLSHDPYKASWQDPQRSLFDEAVMRFGGRTTLVEHRRCMPEIIGFSNRIAYEPDGIRLVPVRQFGADRLEPLVPVHVPDGYEKGTTNKVNPPEVDAIVRQIEECLADPRYDGKTMGVISLLGPTQARTIEKALMERLDPDEWRLRDLRCGDAADFQGSERDVMFLSMVKAPDPDRRIGALTRELYVQRYNVAASRAKDQMWVFHSVTLNDLGHPEDMRFALLDYVYGASQRSQDDEASGVVPEDRRVEPFDSLFEQRIYNRLVDRGYVVIPQVEAIGYRLDLVVVGARGRLAIECDGDRWHGPEAYERDLARQRDLERCGWQFFRVRESAYYVDPAGELAKLWDLLAELQIHPSGWQEESADAEGGPVVLTPSEPAAPEHVQDAEPVNEPVGTSAAPDSLLPRGDEDPTGEAAPAAPLAEDVHVEADVPRETWVDRDTSTTQEEEQVAPVEADAPVESPASMPEVVSAWSRPATEPSTASELAPHMTASGHAPAVFEASAADVERALLDIVAVEGPMLGTVLQRSYVRLAGGQRVGKNIASELNKRISALVRTGALVADNPTGESGVKFKTYRLPDQRAVAVRQLGDRSLEDVPISELAALIIQTSERLTTGFDEHEPLMRAVLDQLGLRRMTTGVAARLESAHDLAEEIVMAEFEG